MITNLTGTPARLCQAAIGTSSAIIYTASVDGRAAILDYNICNTDSSNVSLTIGIGGVTTDKALFYTMVVSGKTTVQLSVFQMLNKSETLQAVASSTGITVTINGLERV